MKTILVAFLAEVAGLPAGETGNNGGALMRQEEANEIKDSKMSYITPVNQEFLIGTSELPTFH